MTRRQVALGLLVLVVLLQGVTLAVLVDHDRHPVRVLVCGREGEGCRDAVQVQP